VCESLDIAPEEVVAFGDNHNDIAMVTWAGRGIAMGNAHPALLAAVDEQTLSNVEDGVAVVLETLV
jgi:hydroxymethylpyrimidine pyrophosphatase-like HAD family hydrolase